jgi:hypothetical protein
MASWSTDVTGDLVEFMLFDHSEIADYVRT